MSRNIQVRNLPTRIARRVRAGVFLAALGLAAGAEGQKPRVVPPPPKRTNAQPARQAPAQAPAPQPTRAPVERPATTTIPTTIPTTPSAGGGTPLVSLGHPAQTQQHLAGWMQAHRNLPLVQQQQALENEPGFRQQAPAEQERLRQQLTQLNRMPPEKLNQRTQFIEQMERLAPAQRQQVRNVLGQLGSLPEDRQHAVKRAYLQLRDLPEGQRLAYMNSPQFRLQFNPQEQSTVVNLVNSAPLLRSFEAPPSVPRD